jgi:nitroreductase
VPDEVLLEILTEARWGPSSSNMQTTLVYVLKGESLERYKADMLAYARPG